MRLVKATKTNVEILEGEYQGHQINIWQYPKTVLIEIDGAIVGVNRKQLIKFLNRKPE